MISRTTGTSVLGFALSQLPFSVLSVFYLSNLHLVYEFPCHPLFYLELCQFAIRSYLSYISTHAFRLVIQVTCWSLCLSSIRFRYCWPFGCGFCEAAVIIDWTTQFIYFFKVSFSLSLSFPDPSAHAPQPLKITHNSSLKLMHHILLNPTHHTP